MLRINNLTLSLDEAIDKTAEIINLKKKITKKYRMNPQIIKGLRIFKKAVDARRDEVRFVYNVDVSLDNETALLKQDLPNVKLSPDLEYHEVPQGDIPLEKRPVIIGFGPSGIFAALILARRGFKPLVLERGLEITRRTDKWNEFLSSRTFSEHGSILFGEGGAGTFSDGKLTTLVNDFRSRYILETFVEHGADPEVLYLNKPHIGTDSLKPIITSIRQEITRLGGSVRFDSLVTGFEISESRISGVIVNDKETIKTDVVLMGIGHSARDTFKRLYESSVPISQKPFSVGVRIEHPQSVINKAQYGKFANHPALGAADYKLVHHSPSGRTAYTFCMCPGGYVVGSISEEGTVVTNGMSLNARDNRLANSALLVNVQPEDFPSDHPLAGVEMQRKYERLAFELAGKNYHAPVQLVKDFLNKQNSKTTGDVIPSYRPGYSFVQMDDIFPSYITDTLREAIIQFDKRLKGFAMGDAILTGPETRSSSPIRIVRDKYHESRIKGLYPMGEGAGYAGGIMSSAIDGIKTAEEIIKKYKNT